MTPVQSALDRCLSLMSRAAPHPMDRDEWHSTQRTAAMILARSAAEDRPRKSFWIAGSIFVIGLTIGHLSAMLW